MSVGVVRLAGDFGERCDVGFACESVSIRYGSLWRNQCEYSLEFPFQLLANEIAAVAAGNHAQLDIERLIEPVLNIGLPGSQGHDQACAFSLFSS